MAYTQISCVYIHDVFVSNTVKQGLTKARLRGTVRMQFFCNSSVWPRSKTASASAEVRKLIVPVMQIKSASDFTLVDERYSAEFRLETTLHTQLLFLPLGSGSSR